MANDNQRWPHHFGPIWIDPNYYYRQYYRDPMMPGPWQGWETVTTDHTTPYVPPRPAPVDEERIRKIVRKEIADLPISFDVPDAPPDPEAGA